MARISKLVEMDVDLICIDTAHGHSKGVLDTVKNVRQEFPDLQIVGGNVATGEGAKALVDAGVSSCIESLQLLNDEVLARGSFEGPKLLV